MKKGIVLVVVVWIAGLLVASVPQPDPEATLLETWQKTGTETERYNIHHGGRSRQIPQEEVQHLAERLAQAWNLELADPTVFADGTRWTAEGNWGRNIRVQCIVINDKPHQSFVQPYISIQVTGRGHPDSHQLSDARNRIIQTLQQNQIQPRIHFSLQGRLSSASTSMDQSDRDRVIGSVLQHLGANEVESMHTERTTSVSAYTPLFSRGLTTSGGRMNVQVAAKYDHNDDGIILTVGTPIITIEY
ncbi:YwmB family TATA-box binding protein [Desmospora activa]|uniref:TATA-box binding protein n=1 Tax=Desmospora activa DSM 45169 TaxID=1121389 RepID=A0A2T4Z4D2_9BACL|nr:YwmB family TATA-box binding protein [Desmospora activa]PTM56736.1 TATA-box binding protein [Desmospora activa DSM 45169]